jgi:hypothetical protein
MVILLLFCVKKLGAENNCFFYKNIVLEKKYVCNYIMDLSQITLPIEEYCRNLDIELKKNSIGVIINFPDLNLNDKNHLKIFKMMIKYPYFLVRNQKYIYQIFHIEEKTDEYYEILENILRNDKLRLIIKKSKNIFISIKDKKTIMMIMQYYDDFLDCDFNDCYMIFINFLKIEEKTDEYYRILDDILRNNDVRKLLTEINEYEFIVISDAKTLIKIMKYPNLITQNHVQKFFEIKKKEKTDEYYEIMENLLKNEKLKTFIKNLKLTKKYMLHDLILNPLYMKLLKQIYVYPNTSIVGKYLSNLIYLEEYDAFDDIVKKYNSNIGALIINEQDNLVKVIINFLPSEYYTHIRRITNCNYSPENITPETQLYLMKSHGSFTESYFELPPNIDIIYKASNFNFGYVNRIKTKYINNSNEKLRKLIKRHISMCFGRFYKGGSICPDIHLSFSEEKRSTGIYNETESNYEFQHEYNQPNTTHISNPNLFPNIIDGKKNENILSNIINNLYNIDPDTHYVIMVTGCRVNKRNFSLSRKMYNDICNRMRLISDCLDNDFCQKKELHYDELEEHGKQGKQGEPGEQGEQGEQGELGEQGDSTTTVINNDIDDTLLRFESFDTFQYFEEKCTVRHLLKIMENNKQNILFKEKYNEIKKLWEEKQVILHNDFILLLDELYILRNKIENFIFEIDVHNVELPKTFFFQMYYDIIKNIDKPEFNKLEFDRKVEKLMEYITKFPTKITDKNDTFNSSTFFEHIIGRYILYMDRLSNQEMDLIDELLDFVCIKLKIIDLLHGKYNFPLSTKEELYFIGIDRINKIKAGNIENLPGYLFSRIHNLDDDDDREPRIVGLEYRETETKKNLTSHIFNYYNRDDSDNRDKYKILFNRWKEKDLYLDILINISMPPHPNQISKTIIDDNGNTPCHFFAEKFDGNLKIYEKFIKIRKEDLNFKNKNGKTPYDILLENPNFNEKYENTKYGFRGKNPNLMRRRMEHFGGNFKHKYLKYNIKFATISNMKKN